MVLYLGAFGNMNQVLMNLKAVGSIHTYGPAGNRTYDPRDFALYLNLTFWYQVGFNNDLQVLICVYLTFGDHVHSSPERGSS